MSGEGGLGDFSLTDLFRSEVETHADVLGNALLALERAPGDTSRVDEMMRAAHSIKGAARVVGIGPAVRVAHAMEDCFVAAQRGRLTLSPADVDVLLRGVDLLGKVSEATADPKADLDAIFDEAVKALVRELEAMLQPREQAAPAAVAAAAPVRPAPAPTRVETIEVPEFLDATAAEQVRQRFLSAIEGGPGLVRLDLGGTRDLDVHGLTLLAAVPRHLAARGGPRIELAGLSPEMETVLVVTGLAASYGVRSATAAGGA